MQPQLLEMKGITKLFPGVTALDKVDFDLRPGEIHGLVGENGAGKSTLMNILAGLVRPTSGEIRIDGKTRAILNPVEAGKLGIGFVHQESNLLGNLSVMENIFLGREIRGRLGKLDKGRMAAMIQSINVRLAYSLDPAAIIGDLNLTQQQSVEIVRAVMNSPKILILDEPTAALDEKEVEHLFRTLRTLQTEGVSIIYISHRLDEVVRLADRVSVLKDGKLVGELHGGEISRDRLISMMIGRVLDDIYPDRSEASPGKTLLQVNGLASGRAVAGIGFSLKEGEIIGFGGLEGQGQRAAARAIFGDLPVTAGKVTVGGKDLPGRGIRQRIQSGVGYITHDRRGEGLVFTMSVCHNGSLAALSRLRNRFGLMRGKRERRWMLDSVEQLQIRLQSLDQPVATLSGGNQQKTMIARWLMTQPRVLVIDEPTRGIDVNARMSVYRIIDGLSKQGMGIIILTSDMMELIGLCDRIFVFYEGRIMRELSRGEATEEEIMRSASGVRGETA